ncbi:hypothetical protein FJ364_02480 [Candidatus Dependentiae bacterium]|nr:hypothetical protein [Candidatus Dependentiae bacterium]
MQIGLQLSSKRHFLNTLILFIGIFYKVELVSATSTTHYAEMGAALTAMVTDMAANHYACTGNNKKAALLKMSSDLFSLSHKSFFFYNNIQGQVDPGSWSIYSRDCQAMAVLAARDVTKLAQHIYESIPSKDNSLPTDFEVLAQAVEKNEPNTEGIQNNINTANTQSNAKAIEYMQKVILIPALKGLTALAVACTQNYATSYSGKEARFTAVAAHFFAQLLEEYSNLAPNAAFKKPLIVALCLNAAWIFLEGKQYVAHLQAVQGRTQEGRCPTCNQVGALKILGCNHAYCKNCLRENAQERLADDPEQLHRLLCPHEGCDHRINHNEMKDISNNNPHVMHSFDLAAFNNVAPEFKPKPFANLSDAERQAFLANMRNGVCSICYDDNVPVFDKGCGHLACRDCLQGHIQAKFGDDPINFDQVRCIGHNCEHHLDRHEIRCILEPDEEQEKLEAFDKAAYDRAHPAIDLRQADNDERAEIERGHLQICPHCNRRVNRDDGCSYILCGCGREFCYRCGEPTQRHQHRNGNGGAGYWDCPNQRMPGNRVYEQADAH